MDIKRKKDNIEETKKFFEEFLESKPPYTPIDIEGGVGLNSLKELAVQKYCKKCNDERTFVYKLDKSKPAKRAILPNLLQKQMNETSQVLNKEKLSKEIPSFDGLLFSCAKCREEAFYTIMCKDSRIMKVGQYPSFTELKEKRFLRYKNLKIINKHFPELKQSMKCVSQKMGIGAFAYLRRIYESLIVAKYNELPDGIKDPQHSFMDKLKAVESVEEVIPKDLEKIKNRLYSVLSKGLHEYEEEECIELYSALLFAIESVLEVELLKKEHEIKVKHIIDEIEKKHKEGSPDE